MSQRAKARHTVVVSAFLSLMGGNALAQTAIWNNPEGGDIYDLGNWTFLDDPGPNLIPRYMIFDLDAEYTVGVGGYLVPHRLQVERGAVAFRFTPVAGFPYESLDLLEREPLNPPALIIGGTSSPASLRTDFQMTAHETFIGMSPDASLTTSAIYYTRDIAIGGIGVLLLDEYGLPIRQSGTLHIDGPEAWFLVGTDLDDHLSTMTLALEGDALFHVSGGATATVEAALLAEDIDAHATILVEGAGSYLHLDSSPEFGEGIVDLIVRDGATLSGNFYNDTLSTSRVGREFNIVLADGAKLENITQIGDVRASRPGEEHSLTISNTTLELDTLAIADALTIQNNAQITIRDRFVMSSASDVRFADSTVEIIGQSEFGVATLEPARHFFVNASTIDIDNFTLRTVPFGEPGELPYGEGMALGSSRGSNTIRIRNSSRIESYGALYIFSHRSIEMTGPGTMITQHLARFGVVSSLGSPAAQQGGWLELGGIPSVGQSMPLTLRDGVALDATNILVLGRVNLTFEGLSSSVKAAHDIHFYLATVSLTPDTVFQATDMYLGSRMSSNRIPKTYLLGEGTLSANLFNSGIVNPSGTSSSIAVLGSYTQQEYRRQPHSTLSGRVSDRWMLPGILIIDIARQQENELVNDSLSIRDEALLGGIVEFRFDEHFVPKPGDAFTFLTAGAISGTFEEVLFPGDTPPSVTHFIQYADTSVTLRFGKHGDLDGDDVVDSRDLSMLLTQWGTRGTLADLNNDGSVGGADLGILLGNWGT